MLALSTGPAWAAEAATAADAQREIATEQRFGGDSFLRAMGNALTQRRLLAHTSREDLFSLFAGGAAIKLGYRGSILDLEGGASMRLAPNLRFFGGYRASGFDRSVTGSGGIDPQLRYTVFGLALRY